MLTSLQVYRTYYPDPPGGLQEAIRQIALSTQAQGVASSIFTLSPTPEPEELQRPEGCVHRARSWAAPASCDIGAWDAFRLYREQTALTDVIHFHYPWPFADVLLPTGARRPSVMTYHSDIVRQRLLGVAYRPLMWRTLRRMDVIVATSPVYATTSSVLSDSSIRHKVRVIPLGIVEDSYPCNGDDEVLTRLGLKEGEPYFFFIGVLRYYKGLHTLVRAASQVGARIVIAGSGPERHALEQLADDVGARNVLFSGQVSDAEKVALIRHCRALVLPSHLRSEAFGMVLVEAAMFGRPLVSCEIGTGTSYVNSHEETGIVVPPEDVGALGDALRTLLADDKLANRMGVGARARYERWFSGPALGRAYADLYREIAGV